MAIKEPRKYNDFVYAEELQSHGQSISDDWHEDYSNSSTLGIGMADIKKCVDAGLRTLGVSHIRYLLRETRRLTRLEHVAHLRHDQETPLRDQRPQRQQGRQDQSGY